MPMSDCRTKFNRRSQYVNQGLQQFVLSSKCAYRFSNFLLFFAVRISLSLYDLVFWRKAQMTSAAGTFINLLLLLLLLLPSPPHYY